MLPIIDVSEWEIDADEPAGAEEIAMAP